MGRYLGLAVTLILLATIMGTKRLQDSANKNFEDAIPSELLNIMPLKFEEVSHSLGIDFKHRLTFSNSSPGSLMPLASFQPSISVADYDDDGYPDILVIQSELGQPNHLYKNMGGKYFRDVAKEVGLDDLNKTQEGSMGLWGDFNHDGHLDLFLARFGCHSLYFFDTKLRRFVDQSARLHGYCSNPRDVNVADINRDGWLDILFADHYPDRDLKTYKPVDELFGITGDQTAGGGADIILGGPDGFTHPGPDLFKNYRSLKGHANSIGVSDINGDGWPDIFAAVDYANDEMYINDRKNDLINVTDQMIPRAEHGFSGMNAEFADFDNTGELGIYVTNIFKPPYITTKNILWKKHGNHFENVAGAMRTARCGWSWSAKFADFSNSGNLDLFVVNGKAHGTAVETPDQAKSFMFPRATILTAPPFIRDKMSMIPDFSHYELSSFEKSCLFWRHGDQYYDVAKEAGINDLEDGQALALIDYDNDGLLDLVVGNLNGPLFIYHNISKNLYDGHPANWIGISLRGKNEDPIPFGTKVLLHREHGGLALKELYPANGYRGQSDPRMVFGLANDQSIPQLDVTWPDGKKEFFQNLKMNQYQTVRYGGGKSGHEQL